MEFEIDTALVEAILTHERQQTSTELREHGALSAYRNSLRRHDERLANATDAPTLACKAGCFWCCYFSVDVRPVEVFNILEFMHAQFTDEERARVKNEVESNSALLRNLSELERARRNIKCPFLVAGRCSIYTARPQTCRNYHATDAAGCQKSFEEPENLDIDPEFAPSVYQAGGAHVDAFSKAMLDAGYDIGAYELNLALKEALADPSTARERFESKRRVFAVNRLDVTFEFIES